MTRYQVVDQYADADEPVIPVSFDTQAEAESWIAAQGVAGRYYVQAEPAEHKGKGTEGR